MVSLLLREVIVQSGASSEEVAALRAHSIRGIAATSAFFKNWSLSSVLEAASWKFVFEGVRSLGPFVAAGERIG